jgi:hypothetical protein
LSTFFRCAFLPPSLFLELGLTQFPRTAVTILAIIPRHSSLVFPRSRSSRFLPASPLSSHSYRFPLAPFSSHSPAMSTTSAELHSRERAADVEKGTHAGVNNASYNYLSEGGAPLNLRNITPGGHPLDRSQPAFPVRSSLALFCPVSSFISISPNLVSRAPASFGDAGVADERC